MHSIQDFKGSDPPQIRESTLPPKKIVVIFTKFLGIMLNVGVRQRESDHDILGSILSVKAPLS